MENPQYEYPYQLQNPHILLTEIYMKNFVIY